MSRRQSFFAYAALLLAVITFASSFSRPTSGHPNESMTAAAGTFQMAITTEGNSTLVIVMDSRDGQTWSHPVSGGKWVDLGSPIENK